MENDFICRKGLGMAFGEWFSGISRFVEDLTGMLYPWIDYVVQASPWVGISVLALGLLAALAPCQVATNLAVFGYLAHRGNKPGQLVRDAFLIWVGKSLVYAAIFIVVAILMWQAQDMLPWIQGWRKILGPLMLLAGLYLLFQPKFLQIYWGVEMPASRCSPGKQAWSSLAMGVGVGWAFCPTVFWIYFGVALPMFSQTQYPLAMPVLFALGTLLLAFLAVLLAVTGVSGMGKWLRQRHRWQPMLQKLTGLSFVVGGLYDTFYYW